MFYSNSKVYIFAIFYIINFEFLFQDVEGTRLTTKRWSSLLQRNNNYLLLLNEINKLYFVKHKTLLDEKSTVQYLKEPVAQVGLF